MKETTSIPLKKIALENVYIELIENNIIFLSVKEHRTLEVKDIKKIREESFLLAGRKKYALITKGTISSSVSKDAREFMAKQNSFDSYRKSIALIISFLPEQLVSNFYLKINRPKTPTKTSTNKKEAIIWSKKQLNQ
ncbi:MAG: hypothetical protein JKY30_11935 [Flavobacteriales bacterium]|nr:hypothetical protein [Flavobacteriales bacterium]